MITLSHFISTLSGKHWIHQIILYDKIKITISRNEFDDNCKKITQCLDSKDLESTVNWLSLSLWFREESTIVFLKKSGLLRNSRSDFKNKTLSKTIGMILHYKESLRLANATVKYLETHAYMCELSVPARIIYNEILVFFRNNKDKVLKSLLVWLDLVFMAQHEPSNPDDGDQYEHYPNEEVSESISYLVYLFHKYIGITAKHTYYIDEEMLANDTVIADIIVKACKLKSMMKLEILIDSFGYRLTKKQKNYVIECDDELLMKSISLGFIRTQMQRQNLILRHREQLIHAPSILEDSERMFSKFKDSLFKLETEPIERLVFILPGVESLNILVTPDIVWREEFLELAEINNDIFLTIDNLKTYVVRGKLTLYDILKVKRVLSFIAFSFNNYLRSYLDTDPKLVFRSLIPIFSSTKLITIVSAIIGGDKVDDWLEITSWKKEDYGVLDLQYTPLIPVNDYFFYLPNVFASSNIIRNTLYSERIRVFHDGSVDPLSLRLEVALKSAGYDTSVSLKINYHTLKTDIDVLARNGDHLFLFECKNSLLPGNTAELRTSYDYICKAASQLNSILKLQQDSNFLKYVLTKTGWEGFSSAPKIKTCIVFGNRTFYGYRHDNHPIVPVQELVNFIESGEIILQGASEFARPEGVCTPEMLSRFLDHSPFIKANVESLFEVQTKLTFQKKKIVVKAYALDEVELSNRLTECVRAFAKSLEKTN